MRRESGHALSPAMCAQLTPSSTSRLRQSRETDAHTRAADLQQQEQLYRRDMEMRRRQQLELEERRLVEAEHRRRLAEDEARRRHCACCSVMLCARVRELAGSVLMRPDYPRAPAHLDPYVDPRGHRGMHPLPPGPPPPLDPYGHLRPHHSRSATFPLPAEPPPHVARWWDRMPGQLHADPGHAKWAGHGPPDLSAHGFGPVPVSHSGNLPSDILTKFPVLTTDTAPGFQIVRRRALPN